MPVVLRLRWLIPLLLGVGVGMTADATAATKQERRRICATRGATVASSPAARVFEVERRSHHALFACLRANSRRQFLTSWYSCECSVGDDTATDVELLPSRFVQVTEYPSCAWSVCELPETYTLRDLHPRRDVHPRDSVWQVVTSAGFIAYEDGHAVVVRAGEQRVVDEGPGVEHLSLATAGRRLYWIRDGVPQVTEAR